MGTRNLREDDPCTSAGLGGMLSPSSGLTPLVSTERSTLWEGGWGCRRGAGAAGGRLRLWPVAPVSHSWSALGLRRSELSFELDITIFLPLLCSIYGRHYESFPETFFYN